MGNPSGTAPQKLAPVEPVDDGFWAPDDAERHLAEELEKILANKPVQRAAPVESNLDDAGELRDTHLQNSQRTVSEALDSASGDGFEWQTPDGAGTRDTPAASGDQTVAMQWVAKARSDQRHRALRNAFGWIATLVIAGAVVGGAAYLLTGWKPDIAGLLQIGQELVS